MRLERTMHGVLMDWPWLVQKPRGISEFYLSSLFFNYTIVLAAYLQKTSGFIQWPLARTKFASLLKKKLYRFSIRLAASAVLLVLFCRYLSFLKQCSLCTEAEFMNVQFR